MDRLDNVLVKLKYYDSRNKAQRAIKSSKVKVNGSFVIKPSYIVEDDAEIVCQPMEFVSRGANKLTKALDYWQLNLEDKVAVDIGASTGGFTELMLQRGAKKIYAIDVGSNQLHDSLVQNDKVINLENCNIRFFDFSLIQEKIDFISVDLSFISLSYVLPLLTNQVSCGATLVVLIKPQFEVGKAMLGKKGIVKNKKAHIFALNKINNCAKEHQLNIIDLIPSPIKGSKGNTEFLALIKNDGSKASISETKIKEIVAAV